MRDKPQTVFCTIVVVLQDMCQLLVCPFAVEPELQRLFDKFIGCYIISLSFSKPDKLWDIRLGRCWFGCGIAYTCLLSKNRAIKRRAQRKVNISLNNIFKSLERQIKNLCRFYTQLRLMMTTSQVLRKSLQ